MSVGMVSAGSTSDSSGSDTLQPASRTAPRLNLSITAVRFLLFRVIVVSLWIWPRQKRVFSGATAQRSVQVLKVQ